MMYVKAWGVYNTSHEMWRERHRIPRGDDTAGQDAVLGQGVSVWKGGAMIRKGMPADDVLKMKGQPKKIEVVGESDQGMIVEWRYDDCVVVMHYHLNKYRVQEVRDV